jgi:tetratricopeptide (TPR) repeat protein
MIMRTQGAPGARQVPILAVLCFSLLAIILVTGGCGRKEGGKEGRPESAAAASDTSAYHDARAIADSTARLAAWDAFLKKYTASSFRPRAMAAYCGLLLAKEPAKLNGFVSLAMRVEKDPATRGQLHYAGYQYAQAHAADRVPALLKAMRDDPLIQAEACDMVAWDLVERNQFLDEAIALAGIGVQTAPDDESKASLLDAQGWAHFAKGEYPRAVEALVQSTSLDKTNPEAQLHLAQAYDKAGQKKAALDAYTELLIPAEDPTIRERVEALSKARGESPAPVFQRIDQARETNAKPAAAFTLKDYAGKELVFADTRGKVVLLNFWFPT